MAFETAISGLNAAQTQLNVLGNNIANAGTTGFKGSTAQFQDVLANIYQQGGGGGVATAKVAQSFTQGDVTTTGNPMDMAINGQGFFVVNNGGTQMYTRDGAFGLNQNGDIVNSSGEELVGFSTDGSGHLTGATGPIQVSAANSAPFATTTVALGANLNSAATPPATSPFNPADSTSYNNTTSETIYDSLGGSHQMQCYFTNTGAGTWNMDTYVDGTSVGTTALAFNASGTLTTPVGGVVPPLAFTPAGGGAAMSVTVNLAQTTQYGNSFAVNSINQNGYTTGTLSGVTIDAKGNVNATYTNGQAVVQGQVALANFTNPQGLTNVGNNNWASTTSSGSPVIGAAGSGSIGTLQSGALEASNVDVSSELVQLIVAQRNFQASSQAIKTEDAVIQSIMQIG